MQLNLRATRQSVREELIRQKTFLLYSIHIMGMKHSQTWDACHRRAGMLLVSSLRERKWISVNLELTDLVWHEIWSLHFIFWVKNTLRLFWRESKVVCYRRTGSRCLEGCVELSGGDTEFLALSDSKFPLLHPEIITRSEFKWSAAALLRRSILSMRVVSCSIVITLDSIEYTITFLKRRIITFPFVTIVPLLFIHIINLVKRGVNNCSIVMP